jgi:hypothetical protein
MSQKTLGNYSNLSQRVRTAALGCLRAVLVLGLVVGALCALSIRSAQARVSESLRGFASELMNWKSGSFASAPRNLWLNGGELRFVSASTELSVSETLDRLEDVCHQRGGLVGAERVLKAKHATLGRSSTAWLHGAFREESTTEGFLACLDTGGALGPGELAKRIQRFAETGDLAALGQLRYVLARREGNLTSALLLWTEGAFPLLHMFPEHGDAPGRDPRGIPRPAQAERLLSAAERDAPYSLTLYRVSGGPAPALAGYLEGLKGAGWSVTPGRQANAAVARRGDQTVLVSVQATGAQKSTLSVLALS